MRAKQVIYSGRVQGVGFRATVRQIASGYDVRGWVKNLPDGCVEMQVTADEDEELEAFLEEILNSNLSSLLKEHEAFVLDSLEGVRGFTIVR